MADQTEKDEKTEEATPRRLQEARERGQVAFSTEMMAAAMLGVVVLTALVSGGAIAGASGELLAGSLASVGELGTQPLSLPAAAGLVSGAGQAVLPSLMIVVGPLMLIGILVGFGQAGFRVAPKAVSLDLTKLNPVKGLTRMFSMRSAVKTGLAFLKIVVILATITAVIWFDISEIANTAGGDLGPVLKESIRLLFKSAVAGILVIVALAVIDLLFQRFQHAKDMRMSKQEVKEELKSTEGDPLIRSRIRQLQREMASKRMMADVPKATVVVTNPTHYAVALSYERSADGQAADAPRVVAKGVDHVAQRIKQVARDAGVLLYEDRPLARALHAQVEIGEEIPESLFQAVASVLAYVYKMEGAAASA